MESSIQLITDGDGLAVIGDPRAVKNFLVSRGLWSSSIDLGQRLKSVLGTGAVVAQAASKIVATSGRWVKLTKESAHLAKTQGLRIATKTGRPTGVILGEKGGQIGTYVEFEKGLDSLLNPAMLSGIAGIMAQVALQHSIAEITTYLARIDEKLDDVRRDQRNQVLARMDGADLMIERAIRIRDHQMGRVDEVTWSTVQDTSGKIATTQSYALRELGDLAKKMEHKSTIGDLAKTAKEAESKVQLWLFVLARCFQLQDAFDVLQLDRVLDRSPDDLDGHRRGLKADRQERLDAISQVTEYLIGRMDAAADRANTELLWHPTTSPAVVHSSNNVATSVHELHGLLGIESGRQSWKARRWRDAATEARDKAVEIAGPVAAGIAVGGVAIALSVLQDRGRRAE